MRSLFALLICLVLLTSCAPTLEQKVEKIRDDRMPAIITEMSARNLRIGAPVFIRIFKEEDMLELWVQNDLGQYELFKAYPICARSGDLGPKTTEGDGQAPEGFYTVTTSRLWAGSKYHLAMNIGYPNKYDAAHGYTGKSLMIHGDCKSDGCFAMTSPLIEEIYLLTDAALQGGESSVPVHIFPFRMTPEAMAAHSNYRWTEFWSNLKQGYDFFEKNGAIPEVSIKDDRYAFAVPTP